MSDQNELNFERHEQCHKAVCVRFYVFYLSLFRSVTPQFSGKHMFMNSEQCRLFISSLLRVKRHPLTPT